MGNPSPTRFLEEISMREEPFVFDPKYEDQPMEQWEIVSMYSDSVHASNLCKFHRILTSISPLRLLSREHFPSRSPSTPL